MFLTTINGDFPAMLDDNGRVFFWMAWAPSSQACQEQVQVGETGCQDILKPKVVSSDIAGFSSFRGRFHVFGRNMEEPLTSNQSGFIHVQAWNIHQSSASQAGYIDAKKSKHQSDIAVAQTQGSSSMIPSGKNATTGNHWLKPKKPMKSAEKHNVLHVLLDYKR